MSPTDQRLEPVAVFGSLVATGLRETSTDPSVLEGGGRWVVVVTFEGRVMCARFEHWREGLPDRISGPWQGPSRSKYTTSLDEGGYRRAVSAIRERIAAGDVYQANLCRVMSAPLPSPDRAAHPGGLAALLARNNPAPYQGWLSIPEFDLAVITASPELFLARHGRRVISGPIKGTAVDPRDLAGKDRAENVMIVDLVRNDLARVTRPGSIEVPDLLKVERHPGLVHLVSRVSGELSAGVGWAEILDATFPPGSVTGAPKRASLGLIRELEPVPRGPYCGAIGWIDSDRGTAELAVGIRTFWIEDGYLRFGTGAGITWGSDPDAEWRETELKAERLVRVAGLGWPGSGGRDRTSPAGEGWA